MLAPLTPYNEVSRLQGLRELNVLDTAPEERFDRVTRLARRLFDVPIALVSLVDENRQWFKSCFGLDVSETTREISFCGHAILSDDVFLIPDATRDARFADNPLVVGEPHVVFYAGCPLVTAGGHRIGTLCLIDHRPRSLDAEELGLLRDLATMAQRELQAMAMATTDELTGLSNRRGFSVLAQHMLNVCKRQQSAVSVLFLDLDQFKPINDRYGHAEGDFALKAFAHLLRDVFRQSDLVARLGGDEFVVMLSKASEAAVQAVLARFQDELAKWNERERRGYKLACSIGSVVFEAVDAEQLEHMLEHADRKMYAAKQAGRPQAA